MYSVAKWCLTLCNSMDCSLPVFCPWGFLGKSTGVGCHFLLQYSLEGLMLKLKLQYFGRLIGRANLLEKTLILGKIEGKRIRGWQRMRWLDSITDST